MYNYQQDTTNIWFPDQREPIYDPADPILSYHFEEYWKKEKDRCINGFYLADGQVYISGHLYFHTVYWKIVMYQEIPGTDKKRRVIATPFLRDVDWDVINVDIQRAELEGQFYDLVGSRDWGKSIIAASRAGWAYTLFPQSQSVISGGDAKYIKLATDKIEDGLTNIHPIWKKQRIINNWKEEVKAGWKDKKTNQPDSKSSNSQIIVRNYDNGNKSMAANGTRPSFHLIDEIGTIQKFIDCLKDSDGCWWSGGGNKPSCLVMVTGTGGDMEVGAEAGEVFFNPKAYNMLAFENPEQPGEYMGRFVSALRAKMTYKEPKKLSEYLGISHPDLDRITILVSNEQRAKEEWWDVEHAKAKKSGNPKTLLKFKAYWPIKASDCFLVLSKNDFNIEAAKQQKERILYSKERGSSIDIKLGDSGKLEHSFIDKLPISEFPLKTQSSDAPIVMWEPPISNAPKGLYVAGVDPYRHDEADSSDSLGAVYIFKRIHSLTDEKFQDMFVASYVARPTTQNEWNDNAKHLIKYYNATALVENDEMSFINYMTIKNEQMYLQETPKWLQEIQASSSTYKRPYGVSMSSPKIRKFVFGMLKNYLDETIPIEKDEEGNVIREKLGVQNVLDPMLLEEIIKYSPAINVDRIIAASLAITLANRLNPIFGSIGEADNRIKSLYSKSHSNSSIFQPQKKLFIPKKKLFR